MSMVLMMVYAPFLLSLPLFFSWFGLRKTLKILGAALVGAGVVAFFVVPAKGNALFNVAMVLWLFPFYVWGIAFLVGVVACWRKFIKKEQ